MERSSHTSRFGPRQERGIGEEPQEHVRRPIDSASISVGGGVTKKSVQAGDGSKGGGCVLAGEGAGGRQKTGVHASTVVEQVPHSDLELLTLGSRGGGFVVGGGGLWCGEAVAGWDVDRWCGAGSDAVGAQAGKESVDVSGVG